MSTPNRPDGSDMSGEPDETEGSAADAGQQQRDWVRAARRYGPFVAVAMAVLVAVVVFRGGGDDDDDVVSEGVTGDELVRSGPMTHARAELEGVDVDEIDFGPNCDLETERIMLPTVYAPPCVERLEEDNGGATATGVTEDTIKLVVYVSDLQEQSRGEVPQASEEVVETIDGYVAVYNEIFEAYGRTVDVEYYPASGAEDDEALAKADAIEIAEMKPFAVLGAPLSASEPFIDELAARGVVCLPGCALIGMAEEFVEERAPYVWPDGMTSSQSLEITGDAVGALAGPGPAEMAGDPEIQTRDRSYAVLVESAEDSAAQDAMEARLADHGIDSIETIEYDPDASRGQEEARNVIVQLKNAGITTVIYTGSPLPPQWFSAEATEQDYYPEWILGPNYFADTALFGRTYDQDQWKNGFGLGFKLSAVTTVGHAGAVYNWAYGDDPPWQNAGVLEPGLRTLFTGVHLAGPDLTPESFRDGLWRYPPNGDIGGTMSWGDHEIWPGIDYGSNDDVSVIWWDPEATDYPGDEAFAEPDDVGFYRVANGGQRYGVGEFPESADDAGLFDDDSSVFMYELTGEDIPGYVDYPPPKLPG